MGTLTPLWGHSPQVAKDINVAGRIAEGIAATGGQRFRGGVGGKGPRTEFMKKQFRAFVRFLTASSYDGDLKKINSLAAQCWAKNKSKWDAAADATGQQKGYSGARVLADAYRKSE